MELNDWFRRDYNKLLDLFAKLETEDWSVLSLQYAFGSAAALLYDGAINERERALVRECEQKMIPYYQQALERNYQKIQAQKALGIPDYTVIDGWILTLDKDGNPTKTTVVGIERGKPIYADGCTGVNVNDAAKAVGNYRYDLSRWLDATRNLYELREAATALKAQGPLGMSDPPCENYDLDGLSGGRLDAAAWQNYAIANGMTRRTDYDETLDYLLAKIETCIDFYEKAISLV